MRLGSGMSPEEVSASKARAMRKHVLKREFGITPEIYRAMFIAQQGECAVCGRPERNLWRGRARGLAVDHDHETGEIRGLVCANCNRGMGIFGDSSAWLIQAANYLDSF